MRFAYNLLYSFGILMLNGCLNIAEECETEVVSRKVNPDKTFQAVFVRTDCGATTATASGLRIVEYIDTGDIGHPEQTVVVSEKDFAYEWKSSDTLIIFGLDTTGGYTFKSEILLRNQMVSLVLVDRRQDSTKYRLLR